MESAVFGVFGEGVSIFTLYWKYMTTFQFWTLK